MKFSVVLVAALVGMTSLAGCSTSPLTPSAKGDGSEPTSPSFSQFSDVPVPAKATMDVDHSLLLGHGEGWVGRLVYTTWDSQATLYDFHKAEMPAFGWQEITSVRAAISVQTWQRGERIATVQIRDTTFGAEVILTMAPGNNAGMGSGGGLPPQPLAAPTSKVTRQPLR